MLKMIMYNFKKCNFIERLVYDNIEADSWFFFFCRWNFNCLLISGHFQVCTLLASWIRHWWKQILFTLKLNSTFNIAKHFHNSFSHLSSNTSALVLTLISRLLFATEIWGRLASTVFYNYPVFIAPKSFYCCYFFSLK